MHKSAQNILNIVSALLFLCLAAGSAYAQHFKVKSFQQLANDITAYIEPVTDLNDEACALIKVVCSSDFAFSTPLGIVKRRNEIGEVWLYLPKGTVMLTLKHPKWGVIRDFKFKKALESRVTYEMKLEIPSQEPLVIKDSVLVVQKDTILVRDTVVSETIVEVPVEMPKKIKSPLRFGIGVDAAFGKISFAYGIKVAILRKHGMYIGGMYNFKGATTTGECNSDGLALDGGSAPYDTGEVKDIHYTVIIGGMHTLWKNLLFYEGIGYGKRDVAYKKVTDEWWLNTDDSCRGFAAELGVAYRIRNFQFSTGVVTICGQYWQPSAGVMFFF